MKPTLLILGMVFLAGAAPGTVHGEQVVLDVDSAVRMARDHNTDLQQARIDLGMKERERAASWNQLLPSLGFETSLGHRQTISSRGLIDPTPWDLSAGLSASLPLSAATRHAMRALELEYQAELIAFEQADKGLQRDIRKSFYDLLLQQEGIRLLEQSLETARKRFEQVSTNYEYGLASELDKLNALVNLENLRPELQKARTDYETASMEFKHALGLSRDAALVLQGAIEPEALGLDAGELIRTYGSGRLEVQSLVQELAALENDRKLAAAQEFGPTLNLRYSYTAGQSDPFSAAGWSGAGWSGTSSLGISLSVPLDGAIPSSASRVRLAGIEDTIRKTTLELAGVWETGEIRIEALLLNLERSGLSIEVLKQNAELARRVYELTEQEYEAGLTDLLTLEESYDDLQQVRLRVLAEQYNYQSLLLDLEYELNASLRD